MLMTRAVTTHFYWVFFHHAYTPARGHASIFEGEGVGTTNRRVWHMRTFPGAMDVGPTHSPTLLKWTSGLGVRHLAMQK